MTMPKLLSSHEFDLVLNAVARHPEGASATQLGQELAGAVPKRTLQRRLAALVEQRRVSTVGSGRAIRYRLPMVYDQTATAASVLKVETSADAYLPISREGEQIKAYVRQPRQQRRPVGYHMDFLEAYRPNETEYLPAALRTQLHQIGRSPADDAPAGTFARDILNRLLIDLSWASSRLEGNTYSQLDTQRLIEFGQVADGKDALETQMILNHKAAIEFLVRDVEQIGMNRDTVIALHAFLSDSLLADPLACGRLRWRTVEIGGSVYRPMALPQRIEEVFDLVLRMAVGIQDPFEQAFFAMVHLPYLQPFEDVNKRVSRLTANIPLIRANLCPLSFIDVPEQAYVDAMLGVYELNRIDLLRDVFVWAYERSCQQYVAVRPQLVPPDTFRLRYRVALSEAVRGVIKTGVASEAKAIAPLVPVAVMEADRARFIELVKQELISLHEGNAVRFGLRPLEVSAWRARQGD